MYSLQRMHLVLLMCRRRMFKQEIHSNIKLIDKIILYNPFEEKIEQVRKTNKKLKFINLWYDQYEDRLICKDYPKFKS